MLLSSDPYNCFMPYEAYSLENEDQGLLSGTKFAVKDIFHVKGYPTSAGNPTWAKRFGGIQSKNAASIDLLLNAGAEFKGKTITDELAFSHVGSNAHYGEPINPKATMRYCGGSSSGSAAAVAGALVDFSIGSDTGGSVRGPASFCGIWGMRPTHDRISLDGAMALAPSYDTLGWFARDSNVMERVGAVLLGADITTIDEKPNFWVATDIIEAMHENYKMPFERFLKAFGEKFSHYQRTTALQNHEFLELAHIFRITQQAEVWAEHQDWVIKDQPELGPGIYERFDSASQLTAEEIASAQQTRMILSQLLNRLILENGILLLPSSMTIAFERNMSFDQINAIRLPHTALMSLAGIAGLPQISMPLLEVDGAPFGVSIIGPKGSDQALLALSARLYRDVGFIH